ncbi:MAG: thiamine biosynthesis protein ThiS [Aquificaceae bacterium]|nr:thiamine biosynthesis protein ThiS [Aquificaceae bacterium]
MKVRVIYRSQIKELEFDGEKIRVVDLLKALGLSRDHAFVIKRDEILEEKQFIGDGEEVRVINAISGG